MFKRSMLLEILRATGELYGNKSNALNTCASVVAT